MIRATRVPRPGRPVLLAILVTALLAFPMGIALASHQFSDVPNSNPFHGDIDALVDSGVTAGCGSGKYCPKANVTREQMAAFLNRLGALSPGKTPVVNASKVDGLDAASLTRVAFATATNDALVGSAGSSGTVLSTSIGVPVKGFLVIAADSDVFNLTNDDTSIICNISVDGTVLDHSRREISIANAGNREENCSTNAIFSSVTPGNHTVAFNATGLDTATVFDESTLVVQFVPFGSTGTLPAQMFEQGGSGGTETNGE